MLITITNGMYSCAVSFDKDACEFSQKSIDDETIYHVTYDGTPIDPLLCSKMTFFGRDSSHINTYRVCVSLLSYQDPDCAIWFGYILTSGQIEARNNIHNCTVLPPATYCSLDSASVFKIQIKTNPYYNSTERVKFRMMVFAQLETDYVLILSVSIGGSLGGLSLMYATYKMFIYVREKMRY
uniref:Uncharacterized protein LOC111109346 n=1 Tax=Crassostrea virginica TaxID=6565 RepID=A0A8B8BEC5_CRAVI|nr:uncharacterized protein LOC111109346 [Crassostrea virginica]